jgi:hypothetical protein
MAGVAACGYLATCAGFAVDRDAFCVESELRGVSTGIARSPANWIHHTNHVDVSASAISGLIVISLLHQKSSVSALIDMPNADVGIPCSVIVVCTRIVRFATLLTFTITFCARCVQSQQLSKIRNNK